MRYLLLLALALPSFGAESSRWHKALKVSMIVLGTVSIADGLSSNGQRELNPVLGRGDFGAKQVSIKAALVGGSLGLEWWLARRRSELEKPFVFANFAMAGVTGAVAVRNAKQ